MRISEIQVGQVRRFKHTARHDADLGRIEGYDGPGLVLEVQTLYGKNSGLRGSKRGLTRMRGLVRYMDKTGREQIVGVKTVGAVLTEATMLTALTETARKRGFIAGGNGSTADAKPIPLPLEKPKADPPQADPGGVELARVLGGETGAFLARLRAEEKACAADCLTIKDSLEIAQTRLAKLRAAIAGLEAL